MTDVAEVPPVPVEAVAAETPSASVLAVAPRRRFLDRRVGVWTVRVVTFVILVGAWEIYAQPLNRALLAPPSEVAEAFWDQAVTTRDLWPAYSSSMITLLVGYAISVAAGIPIGLAMGRSKTVEHVLDPYVMFLYSTPHASLVPLFVILLGFEFQFRLAYVVLSAIFPVVINTMVGVKNVDGELLDCGRSYCATRWQMLRTIVLPDALPYIMAGGRQALSHAWVGVIVAEFTTTQTGLGGRITAFANVYQTADMLVAVLVIMVTAVLLQASINALQARLTPWHASRRGH